MLAPEDHHIRGQDRGQHLHLEKQDRKGHTHSATGDPSPAVSTQSRAQPRTRCSSRGKGRSLRHRVTLGLSQGPQFFCQEVGEREAGPGQSPVGSPEPRPPCSRSFLIFILVQSLFALAILPGRHQAAYLLKSGGRHLSLREAEYLGKCKHMLVLFLVHSWQRHYFTRRQNGTSKGSPHSTLALAKGLPVLVHPLSLGHTGWPWLPSGNPGTPGEKPVIKTGGHTHLYTCKTAQT